MFPNSILVALLDNRCRYDDTQGKGKEELRVSNMYGSLSVIDGQHRLFSYASHQMSDTIRQQARILVTALQFDTDNQDDRLRYSAKTFVEINKEQKRISSDHLDEIAYPVLGETHRKALAAQIILRCNQRSGGVLHGLFRSSQTTGGMYKAATIIQTVSSLSDLTRMQRLVGRSSHERAGYLNLLKLPLDTLPTADEVIQHGVACLEQYFALVKHTFNRDWPERDRNKGSSLEYAKVLAAFVRLLVHFLREGMDWPRIRQQLEHIKGNILDVRGLQKDHRGLVLDRGDHGIVPDDRPSVRDTFKFLDSNRWRPTSIADIPAERRR